MDWTSFKRSLLFNVLPTVLGALVPLLGAADFWVRAGVPEPWPLAIGAAVGALLGALVRQLSPNVLR